MNDDRNLIVGDDPIESEEITEQVEETVTQPEKSVNGAVILVGVLGVGLVALLLVLIVPLFFVNKVEKEVKYDLALNVACSNTDAKGNYYKDNSKCENFICTVTVDGEEHTKDCRTRGAGESKAIDPEDSLEDEELDDLVDIGG